MKHALFGGLLVLAGMQSSSRVGCGLMANSIADSERDSEISEQGKRIDALNKELTAARKELAAEKARSTADGDSIQKLEERIRRLEAVCSPAADAGRPDESTALRSAGP